MRRTLLAFTFVSALTACGTETAATQAPPVDITNKTITVSSTYYDVPGHPILLEGAIREFRLVDDEGNLIATKRVSTDDPVRFTGLSPGRYRLEPALQPCDGNCTVLDGRTDDCRTTIDLVESIRATVKFTVGEPCRIFIGSPSTQAPPSHGPTSPPPAPEHKGTVAVVTTYKASVHGAMYTEGALAEVRLLRRDGTVVATKTVAPGKTTTFRHLAPGRYQVAPALRPCDGNCSYLDGRTDGCLVSIDLVDSLEVTVDFQVGEPCRITL
jgi:hypothetical protein